MDLNTVLAAVKAAAALHSSTATVADIKDDSSLASAGVGQDQYAGFKEDLYRMLTKGQLEQIALEVFTSNLKIKDKSTMSEIASAACGLTSPLPVCADVIPVPDVDSCKDWMFSSFFCRVTRAVQKWADARAVPCDGITPDLTLGSLIPVFNDTERTRLFQLTEHERVFQPLTDGFRPPKAKKVTADTTVQEYAKVLWDANPTPCSIIVDFPS